ncbi:MAG: hypothetical protein QOE01_1176 [Actinomycetota bacterium]|nr:hypothetical protein [Actinomycetota bacterium]
MRARRAPPVAPSAHETLRAELGAIIALAGRAPSPLNLRPWLFRARAGGVDLLLDRQRLLPASESALRQALLACGAALFTMELAARHVGVSPRVTLWPEPVSSPDFLARLEPAALAAPSATDELLAAAALGRVTRRGPFERSFVPSGVADLLAATATSQGAVLVSVPPGVRRDNLDAVLLAAEAAGADDPAREAGLRDLWDRPPDTATVEILCTEQDEPSDWLAAGQALQQLLLIGTVNWVQARFFTMGLEDPTLRDEVRHAVCGDRYPQVVLELGQAAASSAEGAA